MYLYADFGNGQYWMYKFCAILSSLQISFRANVNSYWRGTSPVQEVVLDCRQSVVSPDSPWDTTAAIVKARELAHVIYLKCLTSV